MNPELIQGSSEWLAMRKNYVMASDVPVIMGLSPWRTPFQLWEEKLDFSEGQKENFSMKRGKELEDVIRQSYIAKTGFVVFPKVMFHKTLSILGASLDGITEDLKHGVEIKLASKKDHDLAKKGIIPEKYFPQVQVQLDVSGLNSIDYFSTLNSDLDDVALVTVKRDDIFLKKIHTEVKKFWKFVETLSPPPLMDRDLEKRYDSDWLNHSATWSEQQAIIKSLEDQIKSHKKLKDQAKDKLVSLCNGKNCIGGGISFKKVITKGRVQYDKIPQLKDVDIDIYRGEKIVSYKITSVKSS